MTDFDRVGRRIDTTDQESQVTGLTHLLVFFVVLLLVCLDCVSDVSYAGHMIQCNGKKHDFLHST